MMKVTWLLVWAAALWLPPTKLTAAPTTALYQEHCATCHGFSLRGSAHGATLSGPGFVAMWQDQDAVALYSRISQSMPPGGAHKLTTEQHVALTEYIIEHNREALEDSQLANTVAELAAQTVSPQPVEFARADAVMDLARSAGQFNNRSISDFEPITDRQLHAPAPGNWVNWRRTPDGQAFSPLQTINTRNVDQLGLSWSVAMHKGSNQGTPLVHNGIMFLTHANNKIQALEADSGELIWEYQYDYPTEARLLGGPTRNIALFEDKLFLATYDAALVAISATSGKQLWRTVKADYRNAYTHSAGPIIANGVVVSGINGCELFTPEGCFITGHDPDTGKELWRTPILAEPGTPEYRSWGDIQPDRRGGGDMWIAGSYDPALDLVIFGTSQPKPWAAVSRGMTTEDAALYTNSTLAIRPKTGELIWHFQHIPGETIDMEVGFERILANPNGNKVVLTVGKDGILWKLNRETGEYMDLLETLPQTIFTVDRATGKLTYKEGITNAKIGDTFTACPGIYGGHNWQAASYDSDADRLFLPLHQLCSDMTPRAVDLGPGGGGYGADVSTYPMPGKEKLAGKLTAIDVATMQVAWEIEQPALFLSGSIATAGGLVFIGDLDRNFYAIDSRSGEKLWSTRLPAPAHGFPITYAVGERQFVAVATGIGVFRALTAVIFPNIYQPPGGQGLYVFELPQQR